ncbi:MAG TPA: HAD family phosphatase [Polyangiaceae bacterium]|jgi:beta-phosphoglucomutase-like phosphatase (HAD superfamily)
MPGSLSPDTQKYSGFIFDCDGTLADSMPLHYEAWLAALATHRAPFDFSWQLFMSRAGKTTELTVVELNAEFGIALDPVSVAEAHRVAYEASVAGVGPIADVVAFLRECVALGQAVSVASGGEAPIVARTLRTIGVAELIPIVVTASEVEHGKPAPDLFLLAARRMGVPPARCLVLEDSQLGILAAERAGMGALLVGRQEPPVKYR